MDLARGIYEAYDRVDDHMFCFYLTKPGSRGRSAIRNATEYAHPYTVEDAPKFGAEPPLSATRVVLGELGLKLKRKFFYLWDFGDEWWHTVRVEQVLTTVTTGPNVVLLESWAIVAKYWSIAGWTCWPVDQRQVVRMGGLALRRLASSAA